MKKILKGNLPGLLLIILLIQVHFLSYAQISMCVNDTKTLTIVTPTGGIIQNFNGYFTQTFINSGQIIFPNGSSVNNVELLVVAGGGGGGSRHAGGGGAGGLIHSYNNTIQSSQNVVVGFGGAGAEIGTSSGVNGGNSSIGNVVAIGGGGGGSNTYAGLDVGSGGGGSNGTLGGNGTSGQGNKGGDQNNGGGCCHPFGAGGGGFSSAASNTIADQGSDGGAGVSLDISGTTVNYAGGGGGGTGDTNGFYEYYGGIGGGGNGGTISNLPGGNGTDNTGGGGGGGGATSPSDGPGGSGGSGIVILKYLTGAGVWTSDNTGIASVDASSGMVTAISSGIANITYKVGSSNNYNSYVTSITVGPTVITKNVNIILDANGNGSITASDINNGSTSSCGIASYALDKTTFNYSNLGNNTVTLTVKDINGSSATNTAYVIVLGSGLNAYGKLVPDRITQTNQYGAQGIGIGKTRFGQIFTSPNVVTGGFLSLNFTAYNGIGANPVIPATGTQYSTGSISNIYYNCCTNQILNTGRAEHVQVHFTGSIIWPGIEGTNKTIKFYDQSDDGFKMSVNGTSVIDNYIIQGLLPAPNYNGSGSISLVAGTTYSIDMWYYNNTGPSGLQLFWDIGDGNGTVVVPGLSNSVLFIPD